MKNIYWHKVGNFLGLTSVLYWPIGHFVGFDRHPAEWFVHYFVFNSFILTFWHDWLKSAPR